MFGLISTKNLYVVKLDLVTDYRQLNHFEGKYRLAGNPRFALAKKIDFNYIDIFTGTKYSDLVFHKEYFSISVIANKSLNGLFKTNFA